MAPLRSTRRAAALAALGLAAGAVGIAAACGDPSHVYEGRYFRPERACLATPSSVDVVEGERPGDCGPVCLAQPLADGGRAIYVATMCPPFPFPFDASGSDPLCPPALDALGRDDRCLLDGGSSNPAPADAAPE